jgi:hypothetical protein
MMVVEVTGMLVLTIASVVNSTLLVLLPNIHTS